MNEEVLIMKEASNQGPPKAEPYCLQLTTSSPLRSQRAPRFHLLHNQTHCVGSLAHWWVQNPQYRLACFL